MSDDTPHDPAVATQHSADDSRGPRWRLPLLLLIVLVAIIAVRSERERGRVVERGEGTSPPPAAVTGKSVSLNIDFADGREREFAAIAWRPGMTVDDMMAAASRLPDGIRYAVNGEGEMMMLDGIDDVMNQLGGGRFWLYRVNGVLADRSMGVYELHPGDRVLWTFSEKE